MLDPVRFAKFGKGIILATAALVLTGLAACESPMNGRDDALMPRERFPITVHPDTAELIVPVSPNKTELTREEKAQIHAFAKQYQALGHGGLYASVPKDGANNQAANTVLAKIDQVLIEAGIAPSGLRGRAYDAQAGDGAAPIILSFTRFTAEPSPCGYWNGSYAFSPTNEPTANFGCASQNNLAVLVADPLDLVRPRTEDTSDRERRAVVFDKYRKGEVTAARKTQDDSGEVSTATDG